MGSLLRQEKTERQEVDSCIQKIERRRNGKSGKEGGMVRDEAEELVSDQPLEGFMLWAMRRSQGFILS